MKIQLEIEIKHFNTESFIFDDIQPHESVVDVATEYLISTLESNIQYDNVSRDFTVKTIKQEQTND